MGIGDLFKTAKEKEREQERRRQKAFLEAERAIDNLKTQINEQKRNRDHAWEEARKYLKDGQKLNAQRSLQGVQRLESIMDMLDKKHWVASQHLLKMKLADNDRALMGALNAVTSVINLDPVEFREMWAGVEETAMESDIVNNDWIAAYNKDMSKDVDGSFVPSIDEMMENLEKEVIAEVSSYNPSAASGAGSKEDLAGRIAKGRGEMDALLGRKK